MQDMSVTENTKKISVVALKTENRSELYSCSSLSLFCRYQ